MLNYTIIKNKSSIWQNIFILNFHNSLEGLESLGCLGGFSVTIWKLRITNYQLQNQLIITSTNLHINQSTNHHIS
jgi:hypothetical protein